MKNQLSTWGCKHFMLLCNPSDSHNTRKYLFIDFTPSHSNSLISCSPISERVEKLQDALFSCLNRIKWYESLVIETLNYGRYLVCHLFKKSWKTDSMPLRTGSNWFDRNMKRFNEIIRVSVWVQELIREN